MQFLNLEIENFGTIGKIILPLKDRGLVLVTGINSDAPKADSNGAGKSMLLEAFCWCIWGKTIRGLKDDEVVNNVVGKDCKVSVTFSQGKNTFKIIRYKSHTASKKPNDLELYLNSVNISGDIIKSTQEIINNLISLHFETFCALMPGAGVNAAQLTDASIKELLENMLQLTELAKAKKEAERRIAVCKEQFSIISNNIDNTINQLTLEDNRLLEYRQAHNNYNIDKQDKIKTLQKTLSELQDKLLLLQDKAKKLTEYETTLLKLQEENNEDIATYYSIQEKIEKLNKETNLEINTLEKQKASLYGELKGHNHKLLKYKNLKNTCSECAQTVTVEQKMGLHNTVTTDINNINIEINRLDNNITNIKNRLQAELDTIQINSKSFSAAINIRKIEIKKLEEKIQNIKQELSTKNTITNSIDNTKKSIDNLEQEINPYEQWINTSTSLIKKLKKQEKTLIQEKDTIAQKILDLEFWVKGFSPSGIRSLLLENVTPVLNKAAENYSQLLTEGEMAVYFSTTKKLKNGEKKEKFDIKVKQKHGGNTYKSNSIGEKQRANLIISMALSDLAEFHSNKSIDFRFLDEPFEGMDEFGIDAVMAILNDLRGSYKTVFVVTHKNTFKDLFPKEITVVKKNGISSLKEN